MSVNLNGMTGGILSTKLKSRYIDSYAFSCLLHRKLFYQAISVADVIFHSQLSFFFPIHSIIHSVQHLLHSVELLLLISFLFFLLLFLVLTIHSRLFALFNCYSFLSTLRNVCVLCSCLNTKKSLKAFFGSQFTITRITETKRNECDGKCTRRQ